MNYPVWELTVAGGGLIIALIAVVHVYVSHFAVGGGLFLVLLEKKAYRLRSQGLLNYVQQHAKFFLLLTMVFGGLTGVGIWFTIALLNPGATSTLIHTFVFGWAMEWVCFTGEIVALFIYYYTFGKMRPAQHLRIGWLYFLFAWLSLVLINGIIAFMLTPGGWLQNGGFWTGFFNPSMLPAMVFRTAIGLMYTGIFGFLTSSFIREDELRHRMARYCARWLLLSFAVAAAGAWWYFSSLPPEIQTMMVKRSPELVRYMKVFAGASGALLVAAVLMALRSPQPVQKAIAFGVLALGLVYMGGFEFLREGGRKPYIIYNHTYANAIVKSDRARIDREGILKTARWVRYRNVTPLTELAAGREIFRIECLSCHSIGGPLNDILPRTAKFQTFGMDSMLNGLGKINDYMPPFMGTVAERRALAGFIVAGLHGKQEEAAGPAPARRLRHEMPPFDPATSEYVLLSWNDLGMHCISDSDRYWVLLPPANDLVAQLVRRGTRPQVVTRGVKLTYRVESGFENPAAHVDFWKYAPSVFGKRLEPNVGLSGNGLAGEMHFDEKLNAYEASLIPVVPYPDQGGYNPYPLFTVEARDEKTGRLLARTRVVAPTATEMGCRNCHGGQWRVDGKAGFTAETAKDILAVHDKNSGTHLLEMAEAGRPQLCQSCHPDPILGAKGKAGILNFPAAIHGWHANFLTDRGTEACFKCHPSSPDGPTQCLRGVHARNLDCTTCHGTLEDHALTLLKAEQKAGKPGAGRLMRHLRPRRVATLAEIKPRTPWHNEPDCLGCHGDFKRLAAGKADGFNKWTAGAADLYRMRRDKTKSLMCEACHGSPHAVYPAVNKLDRDRDNIQPIQYQGAACTIGRKDCRLCHTKAMEKPGHHPMADQAAGKKGAGVG